MKDENHFCRDGTYWGVGRADGSNLRPGYVIRVDLDGPDALGVISGDIYVDDKRKVYEASFITRQISITHCESDPRVAPARRADEWVVQGNGRLIEGVADLQGWKTSKINLRLFIPDHSNSPLRLELERRFLLAAFPRIYPTYRAVLRSDDKLQGHYRRIQLAVAYQEGLPPLGVFAEERSAAVPPKQPVQTAAAQRMTVETAFARARIAVQTHLSRVQLAAQESDALNLPDEPPGVWNNEELHAAMQELGNADQAPAWKMSLLVVSRYVKAGVAGVMFDSNLGLPRQGAAVFLDRLEEVAGPASQIDQQRLFTVVHEIGHALNLLHCFQADRSELYRGPARPEALSWMNYPHLYPNGEQQPNLEEWFADARRAFWRSFAFVFDRDELMHLRHGALREVIMGGGIEQFMRRPAEQAELVSPALSGGLKVSLHLPETVEFLEPLEGYVRLHNRARKPRRVHADLSTAAGALRIAIRHRGKTRSYRHFCTHCVATAVQNLVAGGRIYERIAPSFGDRWYVDGPGTYQVQAIYQPPDGPMAVSAVHEVQVQRPWSREADRQAADYFTTGVGLYLGFEGSRSKHLAKAAETVRSLCDRFPGREVARQGERAMHLAATRPAKYEPSAFKPDAAIAAAGSLLTGCLQARAAGRVAQPHNLRFSSSLEAAARGFQRCGRRDKARRTLQALDGFLKQVGAPRDVQIRPSDLKGEWNL